MTPRLHVASSPSAPWRAGATVELPPEAARHVQVLRLQPGSPVLLFDGQGGQWSALVREMRRSGASVELQDHELLERELPLAVTLAVVMPANDRMDDLVQKATELGAAAIVPLMSERSVLRLSGERSIKKQAHWQAVAVAACEQCGRNRLTRIEPVQSLSAWLDRSTVAAKGAVGSSGARWLLSLGAPVQPLSLALQRLMARPQALTLLSGPEGGLREGEEAQARACGWQPVSLGQRTLRADTAPLAALAAVAVMVGSA